MKQFFKLGLLVLVLGLVFTGCRTSALQNVNDKSFTVVEKNNLNIDNVTRAIIRAGGSLGWQMKKVKDGEIIGTLYLRDHMAQVKIPYSTKDYSILYLKSSNLNYDEEKKIIHSNYNGWIQNLNRAIQTQLSTL